VEGVAKLMDFLQQAFGAQEMERMETPDGTVMHGEVKIGDSMIMMGEASAQHKPMPAMLYLYVADTDATYRQALQSGATSVMEPANQFYGDRNAGVQDPCGNQWWIGTHVEDIAPEELKRRSEAYMKKARGA
jgi:uncharacterized glyoxalase superfamily protein PhnB